MKIPMISSMLATGMFVCSLYTSHGSEERKPTIPKPTVVMHEDEGQRIFDANCSRCHQTPTGFSPSISNTVVRHMRVRANLSAHDEQALIRFLNP